MKAYWGSGVMVTCIIDLGTRWGGQLHAPAALPHWKSPG